MTVQRKLANDKPLGNLPLLGHTWHRTLLLLFVREQLPHAATADGNPGWSRARPDHFLSNTREDRQNGPANEEGRKKQKTQGTQENAAGRTDTKQQGIDKTEESSPQGRDNHTKQGHQKTPKTFSVQIRAHKRKTCRVIIPIPSVITPVRIKTSPNTPPWKFQHTSPFKVFMVNTLRSQDKVGWLFGEAVLETYYSIHLKVQLPLSYLMNKHIFFGIISVKRKWEVIRVWIKTLK